MSRLRSRRWGPEDRGSPASVPGELLHHQAGTTACDMRHDGRAAVDLRHQPQVDRERELYLLSLSQSQIFRLDEHAVGAQILRLADPAFAARHDDLDRGASAVAGTQTPLHPDESLDHS